MMRMTEKKDYLKLFRTEFDVKTQLRAEDYHAKGKVRRIDVSRSDNNVSAKVSGSRSKVYVVDIDIDWGREKIDGYCSCPVGYNCKHIAASLLEANQMRKNDLSSFVGMPSNDTSMKDEGFNRWFKDFNANLESKQLEEVAKKNKSGRAPCFILLKNRFT